MEIFQSSEGILELLAETISEGVVIVNEQQNIVAVNQSVTQIFGYNKEELEGQHLEILIPREKRKAHHHQVKGFINASEKRTMGKGRDLFGLHKNGSKIPVEAGLNPFRWNGNTYVMAIVIDVSERKAQEAQILKLNDQLEEKVKHRTKELKDTVEQLQNEVLRRKKAEERIKKALKKEKELNELKTKFLSLVSHEFKTPLSGILTSSMLLSKYTQTDQQERRDKHIRTITEKVHYLNNILNDFLSIEKLETGKIEYKSHTFKLSKIINEVVYNCNMMLKEGQRIDFPATVDDIILTTDEKIIELCLSNLVLNAIKYSPEHSLISIKIDEDNTYFNIHVKDEGFGIPKEAQKNIFSRYFRAENVINIQGTGIGLNIVKGHLKKMGGDITFVSEEQKGSTFSIHLPKSMLNRN